MDTFFSFWNKLKPKIKKIIIRAIDFEYDFYIERVFENLIPAFFIVYLGIIAVFTLTKYSEKASGVRISSITTNSMSPGIDPGSIVVSLPSLSYSKEDIITYKEVNPKTSLVSGKAVTHRIIDKVNEKDASYFITKGDANSQPDPVRVKRSEILGKVVLIIPFMGYFDVALKTLPGFLIFIAAPSIYLIKNEVDYLKEVNRKGT
ncbi:signal peptidase I [Candidatus Woesebacteria bacterium RIFCSPHIGHO2_01_FULL_39_17]|nr:MAG: signal peptidase I [Candidatus Woesebacteria bacterium RIFCSPHIGHO2_01_FULL_39_17]